MRTTIKMKMSELFTLNFWTFLAILAALIGLFGFFVWWADKTWPPEPPRGDFAVILFSPLPPITEVHVERPVELPSPPAPTPLGPDFV